MTGRELMQAPPTPISLVQAEDGTITIDGQGSDSPVIDTGVTDSLDTLFVLLSGYIVFLIQGGFAILSAGSLRQKNAQKIIFKNLMDACLGAICFYLLGYGFAYGGDNANRFIGWSGFALNGESFPDWYSWFFQYTFAATAATIVSGSVAERCKIQAYFGYAVVLTSWVYPLVVHWEWSTTGWASAARPEGERLFGVGVLDFAGCGAVHMVAGASALAGAWVLGPRTGRFGANGEVNDLPGHSAPLAMLGVFILWFGWYGFNPGSALFIVGYGPTVALCAINTTLAGASGTIATMCILLIWNRFKTKETVFDLLGAANGTLAGLVGICSGVSTVDPWAAIIIGAVSGAVYVASSRLVSHVLRVDDPLDCVAVHLFCGAAGILLAPAFARSEYYRLIYDVSDATTDERIQGYLFGGDGRLLACAVVTALAVLAWVLGHMVPFFLALRALGQFRTDPEEERAGLDVSHHGGVAYEIMRDSVKPLGSASSENSIDKVAGNDKDTVALRGEVAALLARVEQLEGKNT